MISTATALKPLEKMLHSFPLAYQKPNDYWTHDDNPRFDFYQRENGSIAIYPLTGRSAEAVLAMGQPPLKLADLYPRDGSYTPTYHEKQLDLFALADYLKLDWRFLRSIGYRDGYTYRNKQGRRTVCVKLGGYCQPNGDEHSKVKVRLSIDGKVRFLWDRNTPGEPMPCGLDRLDQARAAGYLLIGEGESDAATMWFHGFPFLGISGADAHKHLDVELLRDIPRLYIIEEPDQAEKNSEKGQGFYTNMRSHLRDTGYEGEIFSIRFKLATGSKDPSNLHKVCYRDCQPIDGLTTPLAADVKAKFAEIMNKALARAIPEGNLSLVTQEDALPDITPAAPVTESDRLAWFAELLAVPASTLSPAHKIVLMVILLHSPMWNATGEYWWQVDAESLAQLAGMSQKNFLAKLSYLTEKIGLFVKRHRQIWYTPENATHPKVRTELYIQPSEGQWRAMPSTIRPVEGAEERKHGGVQQPKAQCIYCGSENLDDYNTHYCKDCGKWHTLPKDTPSTYTPPDVQEEPPVDSTAEVLPLYEDEQVEVDKTGTLPKTQENTPGIPKLVMRPSLLSIKDPQVGNVVEEEQEYSRNTQVGILGVSPVEDLGETDAATLASAPTFCQPDSPIWNRLVERDGLSKTIGNARAWYRSKGWAIPPGILCTQVM